jgi:hypothetical protein
MAGETRTGTAGSDTLSGGPADDSLSGVAGDDSLAGLAGADTISGGLDNDTLDGGNSGWGWQTVNGVAVYTAPSYDIVDYRNAFRGVNVFLFDQASDTGMGVDRLLGFEGILGSEFGDSLGAGQTGDQQFGSTGDEGRLGAIVYGFGGNDSIRGWRADDTLVGGDGDDGIFANLGNDLLAGQAGNDELRGEDGDDTLDGGAGNDFLIGGPGSDVETGGPGADAFVHHLYGVADHFTDFNVAEDYIVVLDAGGRVPADPRSILTLDARTHLLTWDADGDGGLAPVPMAVIDNVTRFGAGNLAAGFQPTLLRFIDASGAHSDVRLAYNDPSFLQTAADYDASGLLLTYTVDFRDGSSWTKWFDSAQTQSWDTLVAEYDSADRLTAYGAFFDDGSRTLRFFDVANTQPWQRYVDEYDTQGRLLDRGVVLDDGTSWEATYDVANTQPWDYRVQSWNAAGQPTGTTFYNNDGSVFVG